MVRNLLAVGLASAVLAGSAVAEPALAPAARIPLSFSQGVSRTRHDTVAHVRMGDGARIWVKVLNDDRSKPLVIAVHGAPGMSSHLEPERSFGFLSARYRVLVYDARGSGASDLRPPYTHARWVEDVDTLRRWAGARTFILAGGSYGTFISLDYALRHGDRLRALILRGASAYGPSVQRHGLAASMSLPGPVDRSRQVRMWTGHLRDDDDFEAGVREFLPAFAPPVNQALPRADRGGPSSPPAFMVHAQTQNWAFSKNIPAYDIRRKLHLIRTPTLVTVGRYDRITVPADAELIARSLPHARLVVFAHSGHSVPSDEPGTFQGAVNNFLNSIGSAPKTPSPHV